MNILVTGGTGFIGRYLVDELVSHGYNVKILSRRDLNEPNIIRGDVTNIRSVERAAKDVDAIFHNAALASDRGKRSSFYRVNVTGTENIAKVCAERKISVVHTSTAGVYGYPDSLEPVKEGNPKNPMNAYQKSKLEGEKILQRYGREYGFRVSIVRPPLVLGAGAYAAKFIISSIESGKFVYVGSGNTFVPIVHPRDVAKCLRLALERDKEGDVFNVVSFSCRIRELVEKIAESMHVEKPRKSVPYGLAYVAGLFGEFTALFGKEPKLTRFRVKTLGTDRIISCEKAKTKLGFEPEFDLDKTVEDMVRWYKSLPEDEKKI